MLKTYAIGLAKVAVLSIGCGIVQAYTEHKVNSWSDLLATLNHAVLVAVPATITWFMRGPLAE